MANTSGYIARLAARLGVDLDGLRGLPFGGRGRNEPGREDPVAQVTKEQVRQIAEAKMSDLTAASVEAAMRIVEGTARSCGIEVVES